MLVTRNEHHAMFGLLSLSSLRGWARTAAAPPCSRTKFEETSHENDKVQTAPGAGQGGGPGWPGRRELRLTGLSRVSMQVVRTGMRVILVAPGRGTVPGGRKERACFP
ncbi:hypothetical protein GDO78_014274 [Eleutherodactylus coqui]|uniref:Uncharacterized protein n=1 Tax=Eleutherodactylus coqui TaxID=57060 RepID=A0A8J6B812_ELECQ|nr:hypothetical protein GDO78_014274 [Eleutherodactylus coqui]